MPKRTIFLISLLSSLFGGGLGYLMLLPYESNRAGAFGGLLAVLVFIGAWLVFSADRLPKSQDRDEWPISLTGGIKTPHIKETLDEFKRKK